MTRKATGPNRASSQHLTDALPDPDAVCRAVRPRRPGVTIRQILAAYDGSSTVDVSGHDPSDVVAVTSGLAFVVSGVDGGVVDVLLVALSVGPVGGSEVVMASPLVAAVIAPIAMRTPAPNAAAPIFRFR